MSEDNSIVPVVDVQAEELPDMDPSAPKVGRWYWVRESNDDELQDNDDFEDTKVKSPSRSWFGCITYIGSNFAQLEGVERHWVTRIHFSEFDNRCKFEPNPESIIRVNIDTNQLEVRRLMDKVREVTTRLSITTSPELGTGSETAALALRTDQPMDSYKKALATAKEKTLPELFEQIKNSNEAMAKWMSASLIPLKAQADSLQPAIRLIEERIFSVELYSGLIEKVAKIRNGKPADMNEKLHLMQRRAYMDEECLSEYETGGMTFKNLMGFDYWLARPQNMKRILPFPRCMIAFRIRRNDKERECINLGDFFRIIEETDADKSTFLYIRNGEQLYRLKTGIVFDEKLFPDMNPRNLGGKLYAKIHWDKVEEIISENEYLGMKEEHEEYLKNIKKIPSHKRWEHERFSHLFEEYVPFEPDNIHYDDTMNFVRGQIAEHNRLVLIVQGLLDRSPVLHPHPAWSLWTEKGFREALVPVYDDTRTLVAGDKPDFEAYRDRLNASIKVGSITIGQQEAWRKHEARKESARMDRDWRVKSSYRPTQWAPYGDPGPGVLAQVTLRRGSKCSYSWEREQRSASVWRAPGKIKTSFVTIMKNVLHVDAYKPGDFKQFFNDPRTRAEYLKWAPLMLEAEEYHAGNRKVGPEE